MDWDGVPLLGAEGLRRRIVAVCGPASALRQPAYRLSEWAERGPAAPPATVREVEQAVSDYLDHAVQTGRRWGIRRGLVIGLLGAAVVFGGSWVWTVLR